MGIASSKATSGSTPAGISNTIPGHYVTESPSTQYQMKIQIFGRLQNDLMVPFHFNE
jgi:hypothetical protein